MHRVVSPATIALFFLMILPAAAFPFGSIKAERYDVGVSAVGGMSFVNGPWRDDVEVFSADGGQDAKTELFPAFSASLFADMRFDRIWKLGLSLGPGSWGGRVSSEGGAWNDRLSTIAGIGIELVPDAGVRLPAGPGEFGADLKLGLGYLVSPLWVREAWADAAVTASYDLSAIRRFYLVTGAALSYALPVDSEYSVAALLSADFGFASFQSGDDASMLSRFGLGVRISRVADWLKGKKR